MQCMPCPASLLAHSTPLPCSKLLFYEHITNHGWCEHGANIFFNAEIRWAVRKHELKCKNMSKLRTIFLLYSCKNWRNLVHHVQLQQQCGICSQFHPNWCAFSKKMFIACPRVVQHMHGMPVCTRLYQWILNPVYTCEPNSLQTAREWFANQMRVCVNRTANLHCTVCEGFMHHSRELKFVGFLHEHKGNWGCRVPCVYLRFTTVWFAIGLQICTGRPLG